MVIVTNDISQNLTSILALIWYQFVAYNCTFYIDIAILLSSYGYSTANLYICSRSISLNLTFICPTWTLLHIYIFITCQFSPTRSRNYSFLKKIIKILFQKFKFRIRISYSNNEYWRQKLSPFFNVFEVSIYYYCIKCEYLTQN